MGSSARSKTESVVFVMNWLHLSVGWIWHSVIRTRSGEMMQRIQTHLGVETVVAKQILKGVYYHLSTSLVEVLFGIHRRRIVSTTIIEGWHHLSHLHQRAEGFVVVTAHTGNWELLTHLDHLCGITGGFVSKRFRVGIFQRLLGWVRRRSLVQYDEAGSARLMLRRLQNGESVGFAVDQHTNRTSAICMPFLGKPAWWSTAPARLARLAGVPIVPIRTYRGKSGHVIEVHQPLVYEWGESRTEDIRKATACYAEIVESWVKEKPEQWLWLHRRWKSQRQERSDRDGE